MEFLTRVQRILPRERATTLALTSILSQARVLCVTNLFAENLMDARQAEQNLELIRTLMERTVQYQLLTARAGMVAGSLAVLGAALFFLLDAGDPAAFAAVWGAVFLGALTATCVGTTLRSRRTGEPVW